MKNWKTALVLVVIGLLVSFSHLSQGKQSSASSVVLTENNHVVFSGEVNDQSVAKAQIELAQLSSKLPASAIINLVIDSPGGSVSAGNRLIDFANSLPQKINTICLFCASMGYHMFQSLGDRIVYESSELMSHRVRIGGLSGQVPGEAVSRLNDIIATANMLDERAAKRVGITVKAYQKLIYDELWLNGVDAVKQNHADRVSKISCSKELIEKMIKNDVNTMLGEVEVTTSACPLISGILALELKKGHNFRSKQEAMREVRIAKRRITTQY